MDESGKIRIRDEFTVHLLNEQGIAKATDLAYEFTKFLNFLEDHICGRDGREMSIVRTKMQEACFFAKRAMAQRPENQKQL